MSKPTISSLSHGDTVDGLQAVVLRKYPARRTPHGMMAAACIRDRTGMAGLVLYGGQTRSIKAGDVLSITGMCVVKGDQKTLVKGEGGHLEVMA